ncbi:MerR family transcriptional regulator [Pseudonocardia broussonetiae]|uniref:MerR family transcriptional regulator n=1 Tax=Pseudonocardia broussonetiae TaxID=2736640 RepID=A0A6M6JL58_9PSEU|nr:MerR family transcriptional regulator [Pseudonocardia broussonetiae]QJY47810.1 MerR family transcriptional regulator [Pseudonocardia broussonetiae]
MTFESARRISVSGVSTYRISQLAERAGVPATTLRYYEKEGLVPAGRTPGGYRLYTDADAERVRFIAAAKHLGLPLDQIRELLGVWDGGMCREIRDELRPMVAAQITAADERIADLRTFRDRLTSALAHLKVLPAKDGPCDPACEFLHELPDRAAALAVGRRTSTLPPRVDAESGRSTIACSLDGDGYSDRIEQWRTLLAAADREELRDGGIAVRLPAVDAGRLAELVVAEQQCCPFFTFELTFIGATVVLTAHAPEGAEPLVAALFTAESEEPRDRC